MMGAECAVWRSRRANEAAAAAEEAEQLEGEAEKLRKKAEEARQRAFVQQRNMDFVRCG